MTFYTDTFTGKSIEGIVPYQSINLDTASVQLYWPNQTLPTGTSNQYVGSVTECVKTIDGTYSIILPDATLMPSGTSFTLVCFFTPTETMNFSVQAFNGSVFTLPQTQSAFTFYIRQIPVSFPPSLLINTVANWGVLISNFHYQSA
jgi:hypothetical protein